ncbi:hypothetical protein ES703_60301 [subsurface metagenome]
MITIITSIRKNLRIERTLNHSHPSSRGISAGVENHNLNGSASINGVRSFLSERSTPAFLFSLFCAANLEKEFYLNLKDVESATEEIRNLSIHRSKAWVISQLSWLIEDIKDVLEGKKPTHLKKFYHTHSSARSGDSRRASPKTNRIGGPVGVP